MNIINYNYLKSKYYHWQSLQDGVLKDISNEERQNFLNIYREEFDARALYCLTCPGDVANLVRAVFTQFDNYEQHHTSKSNDSSIGQDTPNSGDRTGRRNRSRR